MNSSIAPAVRDFLYAGSLSLGVSLGGVAPLVFTRKRLTRMSRARRRIFGAVFFALSLFFLTSSFVASSGSVLLDGPLLIAALPFLLVSLFGVCFPRVVGFPLCVAVGAALILFSWTYLVFPEAREGGLLGRVRVGSAGSVRFWPASDPIPVFSEVGADPALLTFTAIKIDFDRRLPVVGGSTRVALRKMGVGNDVLVFQSRRALFELLGDPEGRSFFIVPGVTVSTVSFSKSADEDMPSVRYDILWSEGVPSFFH